MSVREKMQEVKKNRRILVGPYFNFLFENRETMQYQIHEMVYAENMLSKESVEHEISTYNALIPNPWELKATLLDRN